MKHIYGWSTKYSAHYCLFCGELSRELTEDDECPDDDNRLDAICAAGYEETHALYSVPLWEDCADSVKDEYRRIFRAGLKELMREPK